MITLTKPDSFNIQEILECGQVFRFTDRSPEDRSILIYDIAAGNRFTTVEQDSEVRFNTSRDEFDGFWHSYFDLDRNYSYIKKTLASNDLVLRDAVEFAPGIRLLQQDSWEALISFIISQNNSIGNIKKIIERLCTRFGTDMGGFFAFPTAEQLIGATESELQECRMGYRAGYIIDACSQMLSGSVDLSSGRPTDFLRTELLKIKGIGAKVADCVLLFGYRRYEYFPVDVWVKRVMEHFYFGGQTMSVSEILRLASGSFGEYAGFAQQYLFHYARTGAIARNN